MSISWSIPVPPGVALSAEDASRVGLPYYASEFTAVGRGASGEVRGKLVTLDRVTLGGKSVSNVSGAILEGQRNVPARPEFPRSDGVDRDQGRQDGDPLAFSPT